MVKEIIVRVDSNLKLWLENRKKKFSFNLSHLGILSLILSEAMWQSEENIQMPWFSSAGSSDDSLWFNNEDSTVPVSHSEKTSVLSEDASFSSPLASVNSSFANGSASPAVQSSERYGNYILEKLATSISAERPILGDGSGLNCPTQGWVGQGSVSGLNLMISLSEIQVKFIPFCPVSLIQLMH